MSDSAPIGPSTPTKVAILGGSGFMGYDLARTLQESQAFEPIVYSTSAKSLVNLARHDIDIRLIRYADLSQTQLPADVRFLVNYAHPFGNREALSVKSQVRILSDFMIGNLQRLPELRAIHLSSMSVYEPFEAGREFAEPSRLNAPRADRYARSKCDFEAKLEAHTALAERLLMLRPTVVYGPFCRPWTDAILAEFDAGDIEYRDLSGRVQPLLVSDLTDFIIERFADFAPGTFNLAGPQILSWHEFLNFFGNLVSRGRLVERAQPDLSPQGTAAGILREASDLLRMNLRQPRVKELARLWLRRLPAPWIERIKQRFNDNLGPLARSVAARPPDPGVFCDAFFADDRLVSMRATNERFPQTELTRLESTGDLLSRYHRFRFSDEVLT
ncbi:MAG: NAD-dependent epimerase/dehydratase family protein [Deltaproteobacteria bacterium]|nr:NAD-dependent epimerase/dehydratase family protein [Deltaproteobacteria bacterium]